MEIHTDNGIIYPETFNFLNSIHLLPDERLLNLEVLAMKHKYPIIQRQVGFFLRSIIAAGNINHILELGTNIAYSSIFMACKNPHVDIVTVEKDETIIGIAKKHINDFSIHTIKIVHNDAISYLETHTQVDNYDMVFIDANKQENLIYCHLLWNQCRRKAVVIIDNILWKGRVSGRTPIDKRHKNSTNHILNFIQTIMNDSRWIVQILPIGDGLCLLIKK